MQRDKWRFEKGFMWLTVMLAVCVMLVYPVFAESADGEALQKEQWVFLLADPEDDSSCAFYAKPSLAGYETGGDMEIALNMAIGDKNYEIELYPAESQDGWYISDKYSIAGAAWKMDYEVDVQIADDEGVLAEEHLTKTDMAAQWPEVTDGKLELTLDKEGRLEKNEFEWYQWIAQSENPLFTYKVDAQTDCIVRLTQNKIKIEKAADDSSFSIAVSDPSGNRRTAQVNIIVASQTGNKAIIGIGAVIVIILIVGAVFLLKKIRGGNSVSDSEAGKDSSISDSGVPGRIFSGSGRKQQEIMEAKQAVEAVHQRIDRLVKRCRTRRSEVIEIRHAAEERVKTDGQESAYSLEDVQRIAACADELEANVGYMNLDTMVGVLKSVADDLRKMCGNEKVPVSKDARDNEIAKNYIDTAVREEYLVAICAEEAVLEAWLNEADKALQLLKEIVDREERPFEKNIEILVDAGTMQYRGRRVAKSTYGLAQPGVFALDNVRLLGKDGSWRTLPDILGYRTEIRVFAKSETGIRIVASRPIFKEDGEKTGILEFSYEQDVQLVVEGAQIVLQFK